MEGTGRSVGGRARTGSVRPLHPALLDALDELAHAVHLVQAVRALAEHELGRDDTGVHEVLERQLARCADAARAYLQRLEVAR
jgi:hypothetical protein